MFFFFDTQRTRMTKHNICDFNLICANVIKFQGCTQLPFSFRDDVRKRKKKIRK